MFTQFNKQDDALMSIYQTKDYSKFKSLMGNRILNPRNIKKIKLAIEKKQLVCPICVNEKYEIIDGQHRFEVCKDLNIPLHYYVAKGYGLNEVQILNDNQSNWTAKDYLDSYCERQFPEYLKMREFLSKFKGIGMSNAIMILQNKVNGQYVNKGNCSKKEDYKINIFNNGTFVCTDIHKSYKVANSLFALEGKIEFFKKRTFVIAFM